MICSVTLRSYLVGTGSSVWGITNISGVDDVIVKSYDTDLHFADGVVATADHLAAAPIIVDCITRGVTAAGAEAAAAALRAAWLPSAVDITCSINFAGYDVSVSGRPRGCTFQRAQAHAGIITAQLTFLDTKQA